MIQRGTRFTRFNLDPWNRLVATFANAENRTRAKILARFTKIYKQFVHSRYEVYAAGGGDWAPLKRRRRAGHPHGAHILRDTDTLYSETDPDGPGMVGKVLPSGVRINLGRPVPHPGGALISEVAAFHQRGTPNMPAREILAEPDDATYDMMRGAVFIETRLL